MVVLIKLKQICKIHLALKLNVTKLRASTIIETLVASVIIILIFTVASLTLNNIFKGAIEKDLAKIENHLVKLSYLEQNEIIVAPYYEDFNEWEINLYKENETSFVIVEATNKKNKKHIRKQFIDVNQ